MVPSAENSWKLITIFFMVLGIGAVVFINRQIKEVPLHKLSLRSGTYPSQKTQKELRSFVDTRNWVLGINLTQVNFRSNTREHSFGYFKVSEVQESWNIFIARNATVPLFNDDVQYNTSIMNLINGELGCSRIGSTLINKLVPELQRYSEIVCMIPLPPSGNGFTGYLNIFLTKVPSEEEILEIKDTGTKLAVLIYENEVLKKR